MSEGQDSGTAEQGEEPAKRLPWWKRLWRWTEFGKKTGWNWLELLSALAIPVVLAVAGFHFTQQQDERQRQFEEDRADRERTAENRRAEVDRQIEERRADDEALQAYLDQMNNLVLEHNLRNSKEDSGVRTLARARTLTVLARLDPSRRTEVIRFLVEAGLVQSVDERDPIISLAGADLSGANLSFADLFGADLFGADLSHTYLRYANLSTANLATADLSHADLSHADVTLEQLDQASSLEGATIPDLPEYRELED